MSVLSAGCVDDVKCFSSWRNSRFFFPTSSSVEIKAEYLCVEGWDALVYK